MKYTGGSICPESNEATSFTINLYCDPDAAWDYYDFSPGMIGDICAPYLDTVSRAACSNLSVSQLWGYLEQYKYEFGAFFLVIGLALVFAGRILLKPAVCFAGFISTVALSCFIYYTVYLEDTSDLAEFWYFLGGGAHAGIAVGILLACCVRVGAAVLAGWGGVCGGLILYEAVIYRAEMVW